MFFPKLMVSSFLFLGVNALSSELTIEQMPELSQKAIETLKEIDPDVVPKIYAYSGSFSGSDATVRFFYKDEVNQTQRVIFGCHSHNEEVECHRE